MASRALTRPTGKPLAADWRAAWRRSLSRAGQLSGAAVLFAAVVFLALALVSYTQTDPSGSTAAGDEVANWMGRPGAWAAERALLVFGLVSILLLPMLYAFASKLWRDHENEETPHGHRWWRTLALLVLGMALIATAVTLTFGELGNLPASLGGLSGLLGAGAIRALAGRLPEAARMWTILALGLGCLGGGLAIAGKVFAFDWAMLLTLPHALRRAPGETVRAPPRRARAAPAPLDLADGAAPRRAPEISDPS
ncbi:MAG: DNA translocase FtsK 4TM domain-containing protein, partial [Croceibacterium sp.]